MHNTHGIHNSSTHNCTQYMMCISLMAWVVTNNFEFPKFYRYPRVFNLPHSCLNNPQSEHPCRGRRYHAARRSRLKHETAHLQDYIQILILDPAGVLRSRAKHAWLHVLLARHASRERKALGHHHHLHHHQHLHLHVYHDLRLYLRHLGQRVLFIVCFAPPARRF